MTTDAGTPGHGGGAGWWSNAEGRFEGLPRDAFWGSGAGHQVLLVVPSLDLVAVRNGGALDASLEHHAALHTYLFRSLIEAVIGAAPHPVSPVIAGIDWAPADAIVRRAPGGDNWPITWGDDDRQPAEVEPRPRRPRRRVRASRTVLPAERHLPPGTEALPAGADAAGKPPPAGPPLRGWARRVRRAAALGAVDDGVLHRALGRRSGRVGELPDEMDEGDGRTLYLVFSGNDAFSVRRATLRLKDQEAKPASAAH